ncbi:MAG: hypothetical protein VSS75_019460 [Candidatus Parabeggiatoa sp.]|nr:hypothetical protein [Candidatus Parabeggiatoa sp.]
MKKTKNASSQQGHLIEQAIVVDLIKLLSESKLSENEKGIIKRRLIENREPFSDVLQRLVNKAKQETGSLDMPESLKQLEEKEGKEIRSFDSIAKVLSQEFPELLQFILDEYQVEAEKTKALIGKEFIAVKRIADVIFEAKDKKGREVIIHLEFESQYKSDKQMDQRKLEYRHLMEMDEDYQGKVVLCNVFYLRGSPEDKEMIEDRTVKLPTSDPRYSGELKYKAYHLSLVTIETMLKRNLPFLLPFVVESELRSIDKASTTSSLMVSLEKQIDEHEVELTQMIDGLTADQMESLRTTVENLWGKSYSKEVFNKSTLLKLMREQLNFRQRDIEFALREGRSEGRTEGKTEGRTEVISVLKLMLQQDGQITREKMESFIKRMEEEDAKKQQASANLNEH